MNKLTTILLLFTLSAQAQILKKNDTFLNLSGGFEFLPENTQNYNILNTKINISPTIEYMFEDNVSFFLGFGVSPQLAKYKAATNQKNPQYVLNNNYIIGGLRFYFAKKENFAFYFSPNFSYHFVSEKFKNQTSFWGGDEGKAKTYALNGSFGFVCKLNPKLMLSAESGLIGHSGTISSDNIKIDSQKFSLSILSNAQIGIKRLISSK